MPARSRRSPIAFLTKPSDPALSASTFWRSTAAFRSCLTHRSWDRLHHHRRSLTSARVTKALMCPRDRGNSNDRTSARADGASWLEGRSIITESPPARAGGSLRSPSDGGSALARTGCRVGGLARIAAEQHDHSSAIGINRYHKGGCFLNRSSFGREISDLHRSPYASIRNRDWIRPPDTP